MDVITCSSSITLCFLLPKRPKAWDWIFVFLFIKSKWAVDRIDSIRKVSTFSISSRSLILRGLQKGSVRKTNIKVRRYLKNVWGDIWWCGVCDSASFWSDLSNDQSEAILNFKPLVAAQVKFIINWSGGWNQPKQEWSYYVSIQCKYSTFTANNVD